MTKEQTRTRNWQKARLIGFGLNTSVLTPEEIAIYARLMALKEGLLERWDSNTEILIGHPLPPYKCRWCGKRSNRCYIYDGEICCTAHYMAFTMTT